MALPRPLDLRQMARTWRQSSKERIAKATGVTADQVPLPSIDEVHDFLKNLPAPWSCEYCGIVLGLDRRKNKPVMDHRTAIARGGSGQLDNLAICCPPCNGAKGPLNEGEFRDFLTLIHTWEDGGKAILIRLRGGFWAYGGGCPHLPGWISPRKGKPLSEAHKLKDSLGHMGLSHPQTEKTRKKISAGLKGRPVSEETREKIAAGHWGRPCPWLLRDVKTGRLLPHIPAWEKEFN